MVVVVAVVRRYYWNDEEIIMSGGRERGREKCMLFGFKMNGENCMMMMLFVS
jgi:hypothetical protein